MVRSRTQGSKWDYLSPKRFDFVPDLLVVRIKHDVVAELKPGRGRAAAARKSPGLPQAIAEPLGALRRQGKLKHMAPVFAPMQTVKRLIKAGPAAASDALASSV